MSSITDLNMAAPMRQKAPCKIVYIRMLIIYIYRCICVCVCMCIYIFSFLAFVWIGLNIF